MLGRHGQSSQQWLADFVQHVRTVHFSLVAVCVALIGAVLSVKPKDTNTALDQINEITRAVENWTSEIKTAFHGGTGYTANGPRAKVKGQVFMLSQEATFSGTPDSPLPGSRRSIERSLETPPVSLPSFCSTWDRLNKLPTLIIPDKDQVVNIVLGVNKDGPPSILPYTQGASEKFETISVSILSREERSALSAPNIVSLNRLAPEIAKTQYGYSWEVKGVHVLVPVAGSEKKVQSAIASAHEGWATGSCSESFATLIKQANELPDQSLAALARELGRAVSKEKAESYSVFGMEFPVESASRWGIVLIIGIQFYIWIQLREVSPRIKHDDAGWEVAWIGVYRSIPARALFILLTVILPLAAIFVLSNTFVTPNRVLAMISIYAAAILSLVLSGSITLLTQQLWERDPDSLLNAD